MARLILTTGIYRPPPHPAPRRPAKHKLRPPLLTPPFLQHPLVTRLRDRWKRKNHDKRYGLHPPSNCHLPDLHSHLQAFRLPLLYPPNTPSLTGRISSPYLHPELEAALHTPNYDLPSTHFLLREMQSFLAEEGVFPRRVLHCTEGDYGITRA